MISSLEVMFISLEALLDIEIDRSEKTPIKAKRKKLKYNNNEIECEHPAVNARIRLMKGVEDKDFVEAVLHLKDNLDNFTRSKR